MQPADKVTSSFSAVEPARYVGNAARRLESPSWDLPQVDVGGHKVLFTTRSTDLVGDGQYDTNFRDDVFLALIGDGLFVDGFESGNTAAWSNAVP